MFKEVLETAGVEKQKQLPVTYMLNIYPPKKVIGGCITQNISSFLAEFCKNTTTLVVVSLLCD